MHDDGLSQCMIALKSPILSICFTARHVFCFEPSNSINVRFLRILACADPVQFSWIRQHRGLPIFGDSTAMKLLTLPGDWKCILI